MVCVSGNLKTLQKNTGQAYSLPVFLWTDIGMLE